MLAAAAALPVQEIHITVLAAFALFYAAVPRVPDVMHCVLVPILFLTNTSGKRQRQAPKRNYTRPGLPAFASK